VLECDIPRNWLKYFDETGIETRHPDCAAALLDAQTGTLTSGKASASGHTRRITLHDTESGWAMRHDENAGLLYGDSGGASRFFYVAKASGTERGEGNNHPTVKPIALMRYLCRLVTPPGGVVLDPFAGSGTTGCAAVAEGFGFIGIEQSADYCEIARRRIAAASQQPALLAATGG
jgi:DNA modification methylase